MSAILSLVLLVFIALYVHTYAKRNTPKGDSLGVQGVIEYLTGCMDALALMGLWVMGITTAAFLLYTLAGEVLGVMV